MDLSLLAEQIVNGLSIGGVYALIALGYTLVYEVLTMINFAHGEIFMVGSFMGYWTLAFLEQKDLLWDWPKLSVIVAMSVSVITCGILGSALERFAYRPLRSAPRLAPLISAIGASIFLQNLIMVMVKGRMRVYPDIIPLTGIGVGGIFVSYFQILIIGVSLLLMVALWIFIRRTKVGIAMRAVAEDKMAASLMGIDVNRIIRVTFLVGSSLAAVAGVMVGMYYSQINHMMGFIPGIKAFTAAVVGGIGNIPGAMLGGFLLGILESLSVNLLPAQYKDVVAFSILVAVLVFRPRGILGEVVGERV
ncbi:MAG: branched-chain amino acid ABC transporter permease [Desulfatiglandales bacterium]